VPMMVGLLQRMLEENHSDTAHLLMTVHDSVIIDCKKDYVYNISKDCKDMLQDAPYYLKKVFNIDFPCKLSCGVEVGYNWMDTSDFSKELTC
jgi:DNA polymerase I-like protein with 3'-5' exonuclease and polymerase domains